MSASKSISDVIRTIVVDDSAFARKAVREMLSTSPYIEVVGVARDGEEALAMVAELEPDVVTCDLLMPGLDGVGFVRQQMALKPLPILVLTASPEDGERVLEALEAGAVDLVRKPTARATEELLSIREELVDKVKMAARAPVGRILPVRASARPVLPRARPANVDVVAMGVSTGGPQALRYLLPQFPADFSVPIVIVLHMPVGYIAMFAEKLNETSPLQVSEAKAGERLEPGKVLLAPAGHHMLLHRKTNGAVVTRLSNYPTDKPHRPSVDVLFQSAAEVFGRRVLGLVLTGMGNDGMEGAAWIKAKGGTVLTEAEESCIIYGMPRSVVEAGLSDAAVPLHSLTGAIMKYV